jgi:hypothetical protein
MSDIIRDIEALRGEVDDRMAELEQSQPWGGSDDVDYIAHAELEHVRDRLDGILAEQRARESRCVHCVDLPGGCGRERGWCPSIGILGGKPCRRTA